MKVVGFNGSPRTGGNVEALLREAIRPIEYAGHDVVKFNLNEMTIRPCQDCGGCEGTGQCVWKDDMVPLPPGDPPVGQVHPGFPDFLFRPVSPAKIMIDRCQAFWCEKYLLKKAHSGR